jgi:hypothetical protein
LRRQCAQIIQPVFDTAIVDGGTKAHFAFGDRNVQLLEQPGQIGVSHVIEDDKAGIDRLIAIPARHDGARMAAQPRFGLIERHIVGF